MFELKPENEGEKFLFADEVPEGVEFTVEGYTGCDFKFIKGTYRHGPSYLRSDNCSLDRMRRYTHGTTHTHRGYTLATLPTNLLRKDYTKKKKNKKEVYKYDPKAVVEFCGHTLGKPNPQLTSKYLTPVEVPMGVPFNILDRVEHEFFWFMLTPQGYAVERTRQRVEGRKLSSQSTSLCRILSGRGEAIIRRTYNGIPVDLLRTNLLRKDYIKMKPTFISRFSFNQLEACFGPHTTWKKAYDPKTRPKAYKVRDGLRSKFSPLQKLPSNSRLRTHIMDSGNNARMNTIMNELHAYEVPKLHIPLGTLTGDVASCCGTFTQNFRGSSLSFLLNNPVADDIADAIKKFLDSGRYKQHTSSGGNTGPTGCFFFIPSKLYHMYGALWEDSGWHLSLLGETSAVFFKDLTSEYQYKASGEYKFIRKLKKDLSPKTDTRKSLGKSRTCTDGLNTIATLNSFSNIYDSGTNITDATIKCAADKEIQLLTLRTRSRKDGVHAQIETNFQAALAKGFVPLTKDGKPFLNGNYVGCLGSTAHWLMPMGRINPDFKGKGKKVG